MRRRAVPSDELFPSLRGQGMISIDCETYDPELKTKGPGWHRPDTFIAGVAVGTEAGFRKYYPVAHENDPDNLPKDKVFSWLREQLSTDVPKVGANLLYDYGFLDVKAGITDIKGMAFDVQNAEPLLDEDRFSYGLEALSKDYLGVGKIDDELDEYLKTHFGKKNPKSNIWRAPSSVVAPYAIGDVNHPLEIFAKQRPRLEAEGLWDLFLMESKLIPMLKAMKKRGVRVDLDRAQRLYDEMTQRQEEFQSKLDRAVGGEVAVWAADSIARAFDEEGIPYPRTPKTNKPSFTKDFLALCDHEIARDVVEIRRLDKFRGTFLRGCILDGHVRGRVHTNFNQLKSDDGGAVSGRFSCVASWTPIVTRRGTIPIDQVRIGDEVFTHRRRWRRVTATWLKGSEQMFQVHLSNGQILTCTRKHRVYIEGLGRRRPEQEGSPPIVPNAHSEGNGGGTRNDSSQHFRSVGELIDQGGAKGLALVEPLPVQNGRQEPHEREDPKPPSWMEGDDQREGWLLDHPDSRRTDTLSSVRREEYQALRDPSHRWRPVEQRSGQSGDRDTEGSLDDPRPPKERSQVVTIEKIEACGDHDVYDITVEEDESYLACGIFSHNSSFPNLQFIPTRTDDGKLIRKMFIADSEDHIFFQKDYSQIEYRLLVHDAVDMRLRGADEVAERYRTDPDADFHTELARMTGLERGPAKTINFGIAYGEGIDKLCQQLNLSRADGERLLKNYHRGAPFMKPLIDTLMAMASRDGVVTTLLGRKRRFNAWSLNKWEKGQRTSVILRHRVPGARRAFTHKALNARTQGSAADIMKQAMVDVWESGAAKAAGVPLMTIHDELTGSAPRTREAQEALDHIDHCMESCVTLNVPLRVDAGIGPNWGECEHGRIEIVGRRKRSR